MAYQINNNPDSSIKWGNTPIPMELESFDWDTYGDYYWILDIEKETIDFSGVYEALTERIIRPNPEGKISLNFSPILSGFLKSVPPDFEDSAWIERSYESYANVRFTVQEVLDGVGGSPYTGNFVAVRGVKKADKNFNLGVIDYLEAGVSVFITDQPREKRVFEGQPEFLRCILESGVPYLQTMAEVTYTDDTTANFSSPVQVLGIAGIVGSINAGYNLLPNMINTVSGLADALSKPVKSWDIWAQNHLDEPVTERMTYILEDCAHSPYLRYIVWENDQGGWDTKAVMGEMNMTEETSKRLVNSIIDPNEFGTARSQITYGTETNQVMEFNSGWMLDEELEWVKGLLRSNNIYLCADDHHPNDDPQGAHTPILITGSSIQLHRDDQFLRSFTFTATKAIPQPGI